jgi:hypothetical protein
MAKPDSHEARNSKQYSVAAKVTIVLAILAGILVIKHLFMQYLNLIVFNEQHGFIFELSNRLDFDDEISVPTWFSVALLLIIGITSFVAAYLESNNKRKIIWLALGFIGFAMSIDEAASIHEFILQSLHNAFFLNQEALARRNAWWILGPIIVIALLIALWAAFKALPKKTFQLIGAGFIIMLIGGVFIDALSEGLSPGSYWYQGISVGIEELLEIIGMIIILYAIMNYIEHNYSRKISIALKHLK